MKNLAIISARSGSKGLKDKNIKDLCGKPLLAYSIETAIESRVFSVVMVSTDSIEYAEIAKKYGAEVPFFRSYETSSDIAGSWEVVEEVLLRYRDLGEQFDTVCLLQPTSPLRLPDDILNGYRLLKENNADAITAVCEAEHSIGVYLTLPYDCSMSEFRKKKGFYLPRQRQEKLYRINGALYIRRVSYDGNNIITITENEFGYIMPRERSIDIDNEFDFIITELLLRNKKY